MDHPLVSVHIVTYNQKPYIAQAIEGVLQQQTNFPFEIVIGEDCSSDGTREIVFDYQKRHPQIIHVVTSDRNVGAYVNSNKVHDACRAKYVAYCDGDDFWHHPQKLQMQVDFLESHPDFGLVHTEADWLVAQTGETIPCWHKTYHHHITQGDIYEDLLIDNQIMACTVCARKEHINQFARDKVLPNLRSRKSVGDYPRWLLTAMVSKVGYLDTPTAVRRELVGSVSVSNKATENYDFFLCVHEIKEYFLRLRPPSSYTRNLVYRQFHREQLKYGYIMQNAQIARESYTHLGQSGDLSVTDRLHFLGSKGRVRHGVAEILIDAKDRIRHGRNGLTCPTPGQGR